MDVVVVEGKDVVDVDAVDADVDAVDADVDEGAQVAYVVDGDADVDAEDVVADVVEDCLDWIYKSMGAVFVLRGSTHINGPPYPVRSMVYFYFLILILGTFLFVF